MNIKFTCEFISRFIAKINVVVDNLQTRMHFLNYFSILTLVAVSCRYLQRPCLWVDTSRQSFQVVQSAPNSSPCVGSSEVSGKFTTSLI